MVVHGARAVRQYGSLSQNKEAIVKVDKYYTLILICVSLAFLLGIGAVAAKEDGKIVHDGEYNFLEAQYGEQ